MLLLHISDIHFLEPDCLDEDTDPDHTIRTVVSNHVRAQVEKMGPIDAILVGGDVAYKAHPKEYEAATKWLRELAEICECSPTVRIFVVPGNHDVDRATTANHVGLQNAQHRLATTPVADRDRELRRQLLDTRAGRDLFLAHEAYNNFAAPMNCQIYPKKIFWHQDIELGGGVMLRIIGLTSTLLSGREGKDDKERDVYLGLGQTALDPVADRVHLTLCHHPVGWLADEHQVDDDLNNRAQFQLFGHEHRQRIIPTPRYVRILAGSVNPSRKENGWEPSYNLLRIDVEGQGAERVLRYEAHQFRYQKQPERFVYVRTDADEDYHIGTIKFPGRVPVESVVASTSTPAASPAAANGTSTNPESAIVDDVEASMGDENRRDLIRRFWQLPGDRKRHIMLSLGLITEDELCIPEPERYGAGFLRAAERGLLDKLVTMVASEEG